ncbi:putative ankyrin repeat protein [Acanthamoeba polyphaga mimivirus]|uniref:Ankyrin repeat protein n=1 Tax=Acanthamoeba polyphaga mimivirus Kroon TaxID=3069720 RepID=A0A0G2Y7G0_9VIRU|nr:putative ankyrin repeat protein [Acanthamoeba polyphaga mimivirus]AKI79747.1 putative ankyrin repeat protein [Acanthamoeba polyphaga mimivirus Kroon]
MREILINGHFKVVKYLLKNGSDIHAKNDKALIRPLVKGYFEIISHLKENEINVNGN